MFLICVLLKMDAAELLITGNVLNLAVRHSASQSHDVEVWLMAMPTITTSKLMKVNVKF